ncbi:MAG: F0F1 ATP synthase subunit epsilon [Acidimicrobiales bacterium]|jgi:F-type H+-transporting ATPase subunit epsilon
MANLTHAELITPERVLFSGEAEAVVMRTDGGDITFLANHMDYIAALDICVVRFEDVRSGASASSGPSPSDSPAAGPPHRESGTETTTGGEVRAAVHGGFVMVADNKVTIISGVAELAEEIDVARAQRALEAAEAAGGDAQSGQAAAPAVAAAGLQAIDENALDAAALNAAAARARARIQAAAQLKANLSHL